jgi:hypothetical protein
MFVLGYLVSAREIEANPEKIQAILTMRKPTKLKEMQQLTARVAALSRIIAMLGERRYPFTLSSNKDNSLSGTRKQIRLLSI